MGIKEYYSDLFISTSSDMATSLTSDNVRLPHGKGYSIHAFYTGSPVGTIAIEASVDGVNFVEVPSTATAVSGAGDTLYNVSDAYYIVARLKYTRTSGTGTLSAKAGVKA